ncbi:MAG TPA: hypothetical protein PK765_00405 [bacterium]|nr:hypothetical protein [bacterium]
MSFLETLGRPLRITLIGVCCLAFLVYGGMAAFVSIVFVRFQLDNEPLDTSDADRIEQRIAARLDADDFGVVDHAVWSRLFARVFYAYGRVNRYERHPIETDREALVGILREAYDEIESVHRERMLTVGSVGVPGGAIYQ